MIRSRCVVGIDPSLTGFAMVAMYQDGTTVEKEIKTKAVKTLSDRMTRLRTLAREAESFVKEHIPELCLIEGYAFGAKGRAIISLGELGGVVRHFVVGLADNTVEVPPSTVKRFLTGKGNANKLDVVQKLGRRFDREFKTDNIADAFGLALLGSVVLDFRSPNTNFERDAVSLVKTMIQQET